jgi:chaperonin GroES
MIRPMRDHIIVEKQQENAYSGGIVMVPGALNQSRGTILAVSAVEEIFAVGENILFGKNSGKVLEHEGTEYLILRHEDIMAKVEKS